MIAIVITLESLRIILSGAKTIFWKMRPLFANFGYATIRALFLQNELAKVPIQYGATSGGRINKTGESGRHDRMHNCRSWKGRLSLSKLHRSCLYSGSRSNRSYRGRFCPTSNHSEYNQMRIRRRQTGLIREFQSKCGLEVQLNASRNTFGLERRWCFKTLGAKIM